MSEPDPDADQTALTLEVSPQDDGVRLDKWLAGQLPQHSRARLQAWIKDGQVQVDGQIQPPKWRLLGGSRVDVQPAAPELPHTVVAQAIDFEVVFEDEHMLIVNKPAGLTVHPGAGQPDGTLQNGLLHYRPSLAQVARAGIVHRLDKDTSGVMVVAATPQAQTQLVRDLQAHNIQRHYRALVWGVPVAGSTVDAPLGRHPRERIRFAVRPGGREAVTHYRVAEKFSRHADLQVQLETGRTHQIRVHMQHVGYPLIGDPLYGRRGDPYRARLGRQALHAQQLQLPHPHSGQIMSFEVPLPADMQAIVDDWRSTLD